MWLESYAESWSVNEWPLVLQTVMEKLFACTGHQAVVQHREGRTTAWCTLLFGPEVPVSLITGFSIFTVPLVLGSPAAEDPRGLAEPQLTLRWMFPGDTSLLVCLPQGHILLV